jgi:ariadne-2
MFISFKCALDYHAPTDCETIKKWLTKCADDSETANYISANTKDVSLIRETYSYSY